MNHTKLTLLTTLPLLIASCGGNTNTTATSDITSPAANTAVKPSTSTPPTDSTFTIRPSAAAQKLLDLTNAARAKGYQCSGVEDRNSQHPNGYYGPTTPLTWNSFLGRSATRYAAQLAQTGVLSHVGPDGSTIASRDEAAGYTNWKFLGENLAEGYDEAEVEQVLEGWLESKTGHCSNVMSPDFTDFAAAYNHNIWVEEFGKVF